MSKTLLDEKVSAYWSYDLANEFDYMTFTVGALTKRRTQSDDRIIIKCDDKVVLDTMIHVTWEVRNDAISKWPMAVASIKA